MPLPTFLIIGAARCGTTSLYAYLQQHPQVFMSAVKEPNYLAFADCPRSSDPWIEWIRAQAITDRSQYEALFAAAGPGQAIGEASPRYIVDRGAPQRIRDTLPHAQLFAIVRNPLEQVHSNYLGLQRDGYPLPSTLEAALDDYEQDRQTGSTRESFLDSAFHGRNLARYFEIFPRSQLTVYLYDDLRADAPGLMRDFFQRLGVDSAFVPDVEERHGRTGSIRNPLVGALWHSIAQHRPLLRRIFPKRLLDRGYAWVMRDLVREPLAVTTRARLRELYRDDIGVLQALVGRDLSHWLLP